MFKFLSLMISNTKTKVITAGSSPQNSEEIVIRRLMCLITLLMQELRFFEKTTARLESLNSMADVL